MKFRFTAVLAIMLGLGGVTLVPPGAAAPASPDSLGVLRVWISQRRAADNEVLELAKRVTARRAGDRRARPAEIAEALEWQGRVWLNRAEYPNADTLFQRAVALRRQGRDPDPLPLANALGWLAEAQRVTKQLARAESTATAALVLIEQRALRDTNMTARIHGTLGNVFAERGRGARACEELVIAVRLGEAKADPDSLLLGQSCRNLGRAYNLVGDFRASRAWYARAAEIQERLLGPEHPELASTLLLTAMVCSAQGDYIAERRLAERALAIREQVFGADHPIVAIAVSTLGGALRSLGDIDAALPLYERAVSTQRTSKRATPFDLALALNNLGSALVAAGEGPRARACLEEARAIRQQAFGPGSGANLWSRTMLAMAMWYSGDLPAASSEIDQAIARAESLSGGRPDIDLADALQVKGGIAYAQGRVGEALVAFERSHALDDSLLGSESSHTVEALANQAIIRAEAGRVDQAWADAHRLASASRSYLQLTARSLSEHEALTLQRSRASGLDLMLSLAANRSSLTPARSVELADALIRDRLLVLDQLADERRSLPKEDPALAGPIRELEAGRDELASAMVEALRQGRGLDSTVARARARRETAERALAERSAGFERGMRRSDAGFAEIAAALPAGSALVSFIRHDLPRHALFSPPRADSSRRASQQYSALVLRAGDRVPRLVSLGAAAPLERAVARWLEACSAPPPSALALARAAERRCDALGQTVRTLAWDPVVQELGAAERVFVVPDGALNAVNFLALPDGRGSRWVDHAMILHRLSAERDLLPWAEGDRSGRGLLVLGGADFDRAEGSDAELLAAGVDAGSNARALPHDSTQVHFPPLPHTTLEAEQVAARWRASSSSDAGLVEEALGSSASEAIFKLRAPGRRVLHIASHGFSLGGDSVRPAWSGARAVGSVVGSSSASPGIRRVALLPGLALAGANREPRPGAEDGFLTAEEITSLDLTGAEWAVLSACETGLSDPTATEAVQGLQRAFRRAGVHTVIMSLWSVDDAATRAWMSALYAARLNEHRDTATAVRSACRAVLAARRAKGMDTHPFHWAAFVAAGDWR